MPIDPSIALQVQPLKLPDPTEAMQKMLTMKSLANQGRLQDQQIAASKQEMDLAQHKALKDRQLSATMNVADEPSYQALRQQAAQEGWDNADKMPPSFDPNWLKRAQYGLMDYKERIEAMQRQQDETWKQRTFDQKEKEINLQNKKADVELKDKKETRDRENFKTYGAPGAPGTSANGAMVGDDPAALVASRVPPAHQQKAFDEIEAAQNTAKNSKDILQAFDDAAKNWHAVDLIPGTLNADQKKLHALLGPTFKDVEGTVRQAAMDNMFANATPQTGDSKDTIRKKREALVGYMTSKGSSPTAKGYGIDLSQFKSTNIQDPSAPQIKPDQRLVGGKVYNKVKGGWELAE